MSKISLIIRREFLTRVRKKSFILMTLLGPLLIAGLMIAVVWFGMTENESQHILVVDDNYPAFSTIESAPDITFEFYKGELAKAQDIFHSSEEYTSILYLPENIVRSNTARLYFKKQPGAVTQRRIEKKVERLIEDQKLKLHNIDREIFAKVNTTFNLVPFKLKKGGLEEKVDSEKAYVGFVAGILIYIFIFMYGVQVMRGVIEEKTSRIVEVIISSVKPFELMMGKIIGVALVGLTQFILWTFLSGGIFMIAQATMFSEFYDASSLQNMQMTQELMNSSEMQQSMNVYDPNLILNRINFPLMISMFLFYFLGGYLLYSALFAAVGAAVDSEADTQQFMMPVTMPLILAYMVSLFIVKNPEGPAAFWFSIIPLTSPIVMLVRIAMGVGDGGIAVWEVALSMGLLIIGFIFTTWLAGKIYRTGILMYGKKITYKELWKWLSYKN